MLFVHALVWYLFEFISQTDGSHGRANTSTNTLTLLCFPKQLSCTADGFVCIKNRTQNSFRNSSQVNLNAHRRKRLMPIYPVCLQRRGQPAVLMLVLCVCTTKVSNREQIPASVEQGHIHFSKKVITLKKKTNILLHLNIHHHKPARWSRNRNTNKDTDGETQVFGKWLHFLPPLLLSPHFPHQTSARSEEPHKAVEYVLFIHFFL